jgi:predicted nuclease of predicted toxin-antitoxin system
LDRGANLRMAGQLPSPCSGLRDQSTHERGLDQKRHDPPYGAKARLSILRQLLREADDFVVWEWAKKHEFTIVSKDTDFHQRAIVFGHPPKIIWLRVGNCETSLITNLLRSRYQVIREFIESETESLLDI